MDKLKKLLSRISERDRQELQAIIFLIMKNDLALLSVKKVSGHQNVFRVRSGRYRVIFKKEEPMPCILDVRLRNENTYKNIPV